MSTVPPSAAAGPPPRRRPPGRYDEPSRLAARTLAVVLSVLFVALLAAIALALYQRYGTERIPFQQQGFSVESDRAVRVDFAVTPPAGRTAWCLVRARGADGAEVGVEYVPVTQSADSSPQLQVEHLLPTTDRAVTGEVPRCGLEPPPPGAATARPDP